MDRHTNSLDPGVIATKLLHAGWTFAGDDLSVGGDDVFETVMVAIAKHNHNGEYFENARAAICSSVACDLVARQELRELTGEMLLRFVR